MKKVPHGKRATRNECNTKQCNMKRLQHVKSATQKMTTFKKVEYGNNAT